MLRPRDKFTHNGKVIYEWEQTLDEVHVYFFPPRWALPKYRTDNIKQFGPDFKVPKIHVKIDSGHLWINIEGQGPFIDVR
jgi:hypothetical protein